MCTLCNTNKNNKPCRGDEKSEIRHCHNHRNVAKKKHFQDQDRAHCSIASKHKEGVAIIFNKRFCNV